jgi:hypothetical protein
MSYPRYAWIGNQISDADMKRLYQLKLKNKKLMTRIVAEAIKCYVARRQGVPYCQHQILSGRLTLRLHCVESAVADKLS